MTRRLPPISTLRALEAAVRYQSFTKAAETLHVTQSAVSHQVKLLEELWALKLFQRKGHRLASTPAAEELATTIREFFDRMNATLDGLLAPASYEVLRIDTLQSFA